MDIKQYISTAVLVIIMMSFIIPRAHSSETKVQKLIKIKPNVIEKVDARKLSRGQIALKMEFASAEFIKPSTAKLLRKSTIQKIELIYTDYQLANSFSQPKLNVARYKSLLRAIPQLEKNDLVEWVVTAQTGARNEVEARKMFHGFIITVRPSVTKARTRVEMVKMREALKSVKMEVDSVENRKVDRIRRKHIPTGMYYPKSRKRRAKGVLRKRSGILKRSRETYIQIDTVTRIKKVVHYKAKKVLPTRKYLSFGVVDSTFFKVMDRNKDWNNILFVTDVTGSMYSYTTQLLLWHKLNYLDKRASQFSFFNDGDRKKTRAKKIGETGGIYHTKGADYKQVEQEIFKTMNRGGGGDGPENDVEALIKAVKSCPEAEEIVLIADNWSKVRDIELLAELNVPVKIIICGSYSAAINLDYIKLAYKTGGSIHTIEQDITNLMKLGEGKPIEIGGREYLIRKGRFLVQNHS